MIRRVWLGAALPMLALLPLAWSQTKSMNQGAHRMELSLERLDGNTWKAIDPALVLAQGDRVRFRFRTNFDGYLYVTNQSTSGKYEQLFPRDETGQDNHIVASKDYQVPATSVAFRIAGPPGHELVYWLVSPLKLMDAPSRPTLPAGGTPTPLTLIPRCDEGVMKARGDCVDSSAGPKLIPRGIDLAQDLAAANAASHDLLFLREQNTAVISSPAPLTGPVIYEFQLAHRNPMRIARFLLSALALAGLVAAQAPPPNGQQRDLKLEKIEPPKPPANAPAHSYAVVVGISAYPKLPAERQLRFPERDAQSIYTALISPEGGNFKAENVKVLTGAKANLAGIRQAIGTWLPSVAQGDDRVVIYFAGHGFIFQGKAYLAPSDFDMKDVKGTGYPMDELGATIGGKIHAKWKVLLTDACHSGAITPEDTENLNHGLGNLSQSLFSLTASRDRESSYESPELEGGHGVFTYYVVKGLEGEADIAPHDGTVTADELAEYVHTQVREKTSGAQNPTSDRSSYDKAMWLSFIPANVNPATAPAPQFGSMAITVNMDEVEVFVDGKSVGVVAKGKPFNLPGLTPGQHTVKGVHQGFEPDGPREETVYPGSESTVNIKILIPRRRGKAAEEALDKGLADYQKGYEQNYKKAVEQFEKALQLDPTYSQAAYYLGLTHNALFEEEKAQQYFKKAVEIDPDYKEAHAAYAGMLLDIGDVDEAIRQINSVLSLQPDHAQALTMLAQAYRFKELYAQSIEAAHKAIGLAPKSAEPHLWLGDSLRLSGKLAEAGAEYDQYLKLSDFDSKMAGQLNYYVLGSLFGIGKKKRAAQEDIWKDLRSLAYFGICDCHYQSKQYDSAITACQKSLSYYRQDPYAHYDLALAYMHKAASADNPADLDPALQHFRQVIAINPELDQAKFAQKNIVNIQKALGQ